MLSAKAASQSLPGLHVDFDVDFLFFVHYSYVTVRRKVMARLKSR